MFFSSRQSKYSKVSSPRRIILTLLSLLFAHQFLAAFNLENYKNHRDHVNGIVDAFIIRHDVITTTKLHGVQEWRAKYSSSRNETKAHPNQEQQAQLPLLLLPFHPTQIILPGQTTSYTFRHGKYMDIIDESITHYESVIGMTILSDDGLLPITVLCEVIEEELEIHMGYRGFSSMEVGIRAVGRMRRCDVVESAVGMNNNDNNSRGSDDNSSSRSTIDDVLRRTTALDNIHQGKVVDWLDDPLDEEQIVTANEYRDNIASILRLRQYDEEGQQLSERLRNQQRRYKSACEIIAQYSNSGGNVDPDFSATSWGAFAAATAIECPSNGDGSVKIDALSTTDTVERLRLGLAMLLEKQMPRLSNVDVDGRSTMKSERGNRGDAFSIQLQDGIDTFQ